MCGNACKVSGYSVYSLRYSLNADVKNRGWKPSVFYLWSVILKVQLKNSPKEYIIKQSKKGEEK